MQLELENALTILKEYKEFNQNQFTEKNSILFFDYKLFI